MADVIYSSAKQGFLSGTLNWLTDPVVCLLVGTSGYTYSAAHASLADIPSAARIAVSGTLANRSATLGVADADDVTFGSVTGDLINAVVLYSSGTADLSSPLIAYLDQGAGLPLNPAGGPVTVAWSNGQSKIFAL